jgi:hypothetical protein
MFLLTPYVFRAKPPDFAVIPTIVPVRFPSLQKIFRSACGEREHFAKSLIVGSQEADIHVIVPRYKSLMSDGAEKRRAAKEIADVVHSAYSVEFKQYIEFDQL